MSHNGSNHISSSKEEVCRIPAKHRSVNHLEVNSSSWRCVTVGPEYVMKVREGKKERRQEDSLRENRIIRNGLVPRFGLVSR